MCPFATRGRRDAEHQLACRMEGVAQPCERLDGVAVGDVAYADPSIAPSWSRLGGAMDDGYYGPNTRFAGTLGAVIIVPEAVDAATMARIAEWARGRFGG